MLIARVNIYRLAHCFLISTCAPRTCTGQRVDRVWCGLARYRLLITANGYDANNGEPFLAS